MNEFLNDLANDLDGDSGVAERLKATGIVSNIAISRCLELERLVKYLKFVYAPHQRVIAPHDVLESMDSYTLREIDASTTGERATRIELEFIKGAR